VEVAIAQWYSPVPKTQYPVVVVVVAAQAENHQSAGTAAFFFIFSLSLRHFKEMFRHFYQANRNVDSRR